MRRKSTPRWKWKISGASANDAAVVRRLVMVAVEIIRGGSGGGRQTISSGIRREVDMNASGTTTIMITGTAAAISAATMISIRMMASSSNFTAVGAVGVVASGAGDSTAAADFPSAAGAT